MENITNYVQLKNAIAVLEVEQAINSDILRKQLRVTYENLKPLKLIENSIRDIASSPLIGKSLLGTTLGIAAGFVTKRVAVGKSGNIFRNLIGSFLEHGVTNLISQHPEAVKNIGTYLFEKFKSKRDTNEEDSE